MGHPCDAVAGAYTAERRGYWMTSVTWSMISLGKVMPSAWAVLRFTTKSKRHRLLDREIGGLGALEDAVHVVGGAAVHSLCRLAP